LDIRGNVPTRVIKLREGNFDAIVLAKAGIDRLEFDYSDLKAFEFSPEEFIPAPAQGVLALQTRSDDHELIEVLRNIHNNEVGSCISIERKVLNLFDGGCQLPLGAYCTEREGKYDLRVAMAKTLNHSVIRAEFIGDTGENLAERAVEVLKKKVPA
jgi:hydroxymethylbilane synthase